MQNFLIFNQMDIPVCVIGSDGDILFKNNSFKAMMEEDESSVQLDLQHPFYPEYRKRIAVAYQKAFGGDDTKCFAVMKSNTGKQIPVEIYLYPMKMEDGKNGITAFFKQVDARMFAFDSPAHPSDFEEMFENVNLFEFSPFPIIRIDNDRRVIALSESAAEITGSTREDILKNAEKLYDVFSPYDRERIKKTVADILGSTITFKRLNELKVQSKEEERWVNAVAYSVAKGKSNLFVEILLEDVTKIKKLEDKIAAVNKGRITEDLTKGLLHSFNNIINIVISRTQMMLQISEKKVVVDGLNVISECALDGARQIRRVQEFIGQEEPLEEDTTADLLSIVESAIEFSKIHFKVEKKEKGRDISISTQYFVKPQISGNISLLREVIVSMIFKVAALVKGEGSIDVDLRRENEGDVFFTVSLPKKFMNDDDSARSLNDYFPEMEIRRIAEKMNVRIFEEESSEQFSIKAVVPGKMVVNEQGEPEEGPMFKIRDLDILIIEDEPALSEVLFELFDSMGNRVSVCDDGLAGLNEFRNHKGYDIVLSDYGITGITGLELLTKVKELDQDAVTVLFSGWIVDELKAYSNVVDLFIPKPFQLDVLIKEVSTVMSSKRR